MAGRDPDLDDTELAMTGQSSELTYRDVRTVLALLDGWGLGRVHFKDGDLEVDACVIESEAIPATARRLTVSSPSIGLFSAARPGSVAGGPVEAGTILGHVAAPGRTTPVTIDAAGRLVEVLVGEGDFVEYGQPLAVIAQ